MVTWNWLDCILAAIVVASVVTAMMKGFVQELISLASVLIGLVVAAIGYPRAALWFDDLTKSHEIALGLGFLVLFLGTLLVGALVGVVARKLIKTAGIQWFDRFLGGDLRFGAWSFGRRHSADGHVGLRDQAGRRAAIGFGALCDHRDARHCPRHAGKPARPIPSRL